METIKRTKIAKRILISIMTMILIVSCILSMKQIKDDNSIIANQELLRAMTYEQFEDGDEDVEGTENVKFSAFFLRDVDGDGYTEKIKGTCREFGKSDDLYMEILVQNEGYLKDGKITIGSENFYLEGVFPVDNEISKNSISTDVKNISFNDLYSGTQKLMIGKVQSDIVESDKQNYQRNRALHNNIDNYSKNNKITLTGTYIDDTGNEISIKKDINLIVDWYDIGSASITNDKGYKDLDVRIDRENNVIKLAGNITAKETNGALLVKSNVLTGTIPQYNGYNPTKIEWSNKDDIVEYNEETREYRIVRESQVDKNGDFIKQLSSIQSYTFNVEYPIEAYDMKPSSSVVLSYSASTYFTLYNNPNDEFDNPYITNTASNSSLVTIIKNEIPSNVESKIEVKIGEQRDIPIKRNYVKKEKPLRIYNGTTSEEFDDTFLTSWDIMIGNEAVNKSITISQKDDANNFVPDSFIKSNQEAVSAENVISNIGIYFDDKIDSLNDDGWIKIYDDETDTLMVEFSRDDIETYNESNPYYYEYPVKYIRVETSTINKVTKINIKNIKEIDDEYLTDNYSKEEFDSFKYIKTTAFVRTSDGNVLFNDGKANYEEGYSIMYFTTSLRECSTTQSYTNQVISITAQENERYNQVGWINGKYLIEFPEQIYDIEITGITSNNSKVSILNHEIIHENNKYYIKILTQNEEPERYTITLNINIACDPTSSGGKEHLKVYGRNQYIDHYAFEHYANDIYDLDEDGVTTEKIAYEERDLTFYAPASLITTQTLTGYNQDDIAIFAPKVVEIPALFGNDSSEKQTVTIGMQMRNNYSDNISEMTMLGKIPFENNKFALTSGYLGSTFSTTMKNTGIKIPDKLQGKIDVYYSEVEEPTRYISLNSNKWKKAEDVSDWSKIKTYLIDFKDERIGVGEKYEFSYEVEIPRGTDIGKIGYAAEGVYFSLNTQEGKYQTQIEASKIGIKTIALYELTLVKYQKGKNNVVPNATYKISKVDSEGNLFDSRSLKTDQNGSINIGSMYGEVQYEIEEIESPQNFELNSSKVRIYGSVDLDSGEVTIEKTGETRGDVILEQNVNGSYKATLNVEDEIITNLNIKKKDKNTSEPIKNVKLQVFGKGLPSKGKIFTSDENGNIIVEGLSFGEEYRIVEKKANGYYLDANLSFKMVNNNGVYSVVVLENEDVVNSTSFVDEGGISLGIIELTNEKIPTYSLEINKIEKIVEEKDTIEETYQENNITRLPGAKFKLYKNKKYINTYTTGVDGKITIEGLYQYESSRDIDQTYTLREVTPPEGYVKAKDITFYAETINGQLVLHEEYTDENNAKYYTTTNEKISIFIENSPKLKLIKKDGETGELLPNTKFAIYKMDNGEEIAKNSKGEIIGDRVEIDGKEYYLVTTDENGEITIDIPEGIYKAVEVVANNEKYDISQKEIFFGIGSSIDEKNGFKTEWVKQIGDVGDEINSGLVLLDDEEFLSYGTYNADLNLGSGINLTITQREDGNTNTDAVIIKHDKYGNILWAKTIKGEENNSVSNIIKVENGGFVAIGTTKGTTILDNGTELIAGNKSSTFIIKYNSNGEVLWSKILSGEGNMYLKTISINPDGDYVAIGNFENSIEIINNQQLVSNGYTDCLIIKMSKEGELKEARSFGGTSYDYLNDISFDTDGSYVLGGDFTDYMTLENNTEIQATGTYYSDAFIIRYDSNNNIIWSKVVGGTSSESIKSVYHTNDGEIIVFGTYSSLSITIKDDEQLTNKSTSASADIMVLRYNKSGEITYYKGLGSTGSDSLITSIMSKDGGYILRINASNPFELDENNKISSSGSLMVKFDKYDEVDTYRHFGLTDIIEIDESNYLVSTTLSDSRSIDNISYSSMGGKDTLILKMKKDPLNVISINNKSHFGSNGTDSISNQRKTLDGGVIVGGTFNGETLSFGNDTYQNTGGIDGYIAKYSKDGKYEWASTIGGLGDETITDISPTNDGGYVAVGYTTGSALKIEGNQYDCQSGDEKIFIVKYDQQGNMSWYKIGSKILNRSNKYVGVVNVEDGIFITYYHYSNAWYKEQKVLKYSDDGTLLLDSATSFETPRKIIKLSDGNIITTNIHDYEHQHLGNVYDDTGADLYKIDSNGNVLLRKKYEILYTDFFIDDMAATDDGGWLIVGNSYSPFTIEGVRINGSGGYVIKYDTNGNIVWGKHINDKIGARVIKTTSDGGFIISENYSNTYEKNNYYYYNNGGVDIIVQKYDKDGNFEWADGIGDSGREAISGIYETENNSYIGIMTSTSNNITLGFDQYNSYGEADGYIFRFSPVRAANDMQEVIVENYRKEYSIKTSVEKLEGVKGGTISGEDFDPYEKVKYGDNSTKEIKITPDQDYEIVGVKVDGKDILFEPLDDGSFILPQIENIKENHTISAKFAYKDNKIIINKVDSYTGEKLTGATFKLDQIDERLEVDDSAIGPVSSMGTINYIPNKEVTLNDRLGEIRNPDTYGFAENNNGELIPTNSKTWQVANVDGANNGKNGTARAVIPVDLTGLDGKYIVGVKARASCVTNNYGYVRVGTYETDSTSNSMMLYNTKGSEEVEGYSVALDGGNIYYIQLYYYRGRNSEETQEDLVAFKDINIYEAKEENFDFKYEDGKYISTNQGYANTISKGYVEIDLEQNFGKYNLEINYEIDSDSTAYSCRDEGEVRLMTADDLGEVNGGIPLLNYIYGKESKTYTRVIDGGQKYYLVFSYKKDSSRDSGTDTFTINSIDITLNDSELYHTTVETNESGQAISQIPFGKYIVTEEVTPQGYITSEPTIIEFRSFDGAQHEFNIENEKEGKIIVHHYIKGTTTKVAEDEILEGRIGEDYLAYPNLRINKYEIERIDGNEVLPSNMQGKFEYNDKEVIFEYVQRGIPLVINHYIENTITNVPLDSGEMSEQEVYIKKLGDTYTTAPLDNLSAEYELAEIPDNAEGTIGEDEIIVNYYYKKVYRDLTILKVDEDTKQPLEGAKFDIYEGNYGLLDLEDATNIGMYDEKYTAEKGNLVDDISVTTSYNPSDNYCRFVEFDGKFMPNISGWYLENGGIAPTWGDYNYTNGWIAVDLTNREGYYIASFDVLMNNNTPLHSMAGSCNELYNPGIFSLVGEQDKHIEIVLQGGKSYKINLEYSIAPIVEIEDYAAIENFEIYEALNVSKEIVNEVAKGPGNTIGEEVSIDMPYYPIGDMPFVKENNKYIPTACQTYVNDNNIGRDDYSSYGYLEIDLTNYDGCYLLKAETSMIGEAELLIGCIISDTYTVGRDYLFYYDSVYEEHENQRYLKGGEKYYIFFVYEKNSSSSTVDYAEVKNIKLYRVEDEIELKFNKISEEGYEATTPGFAGYYPSAEIPIDLEGKVGEYIITIDASFNGGNEDAGHITLTDEPNRRGNSYLEEVLSNTSNKTIEKTLDGGKKYYLEFTFYTNNYNSESKFTINNILLENKEVKSGITDQNGKIIVNLPSGKYTVVEKRAPSGYSIPEENIYEVIIGRDTNNNLTIENAKTRGTVIVHHVDLDGNPIKLKDKTLCQDEIKEGILGSIYATMEKEDRMDYYIFERVEGPTSGEYSIEPKEVTYYYSIDAAQDKNFEYTLVYYKDSETEPAETEVKTITTKANVFTIEIDEDEINANNKYEHYALNKIVLNDEVIDSVPDTINEWDVLKFYYKILSYKYTIEYYFDNVIDDSLTEEKEAIYGATITDYEDKIKDGYELKVLPTSLQITDDVAENKLKVFYTKRNDLSYTIHYKEVGSNETLHENKVVNNQTFGEFITETAIDIPGYEKLDPITADVEITTGTNEYTFYYKKAKYNYVVEYYFDNEIDDDKTEIIEATYLDEITTYTDKIEDGYRLDRVDKLPLKITYNESNNILKVYYVKRDDLLYTIHYKEEGSNETLHESKVVYDQTYGEFITETAIDIPGYEKLDPTTVDVEITTGANEYTFYYKKAKYNYIVEYYYNGIKDEDKTETIEATYLDEITTYTDKNIDGYELFRVDGLPLTISYNEDTNLIKVLYVTDPTQTKKLSYTIRYYKEGELEESDTITKTKVAHVTEPDVLTIDRTLIEDDDKYYGYTLDSTIPSIVPDEVNDGAKIDVYYVIDNSQTKEISYSVEYYKDGSLVESDTIEDSINIQVLKPAILSVNRSLINTTDKYEGYTFEKTDPVTISDTIEDGGVIKVYYLSNKTIVVNHIDKNTNAVLKTETKVLKYGDLVTTSAEKIERYTCIERPEIEEFTYSEEAQVVNYYYAKNTQVLVKYIDLKTGDEIIKSATIDGVEGDEYKAEEVAIDNYVLVKDTRNTTGTMGEEITEVIYYYSPKATVSVKYVDKDTGEEIATGEIIDGYIGKDYVTDEKAVSGYNYESSTDNTSGKMKETEEEVIYYYSRQVDTIYRTMIITYIDSETGKTISAPKEIEQKVGATIYAKALIVDIAGYTFDHADNDSIVIKDGENVIRLYYVKDQVKPIVEPKDEVKEDTTTQKPTVNKIVPKNVVPVSNTEKNTIIHIIVGTLFIILGSAIMIIVSFKNKKK